MLFLQRECLPEQPGITFRGKPIVAHSFGCETTKGKQLLLIGTRFPQLTVFDTSTGQFNPFTPEVFKDDTLKSYPLNVFGAVEVFATTVHHNRQGANKAFSASLLASPYRGGVPFDNAWATVFQPCVAKAAQAFYAAGLYGGKPLLEELGRVKELFRKSNPDFHTWIDAFAHWTRKWQAGTPDSSEKAHFHEFVAATISFVHLSHRSS